MAEQMSSLYNSVTESVAAALSPPAAPAAGKHKFLLYGKNGWIGGMLIELARANGDEVVLGDARLENREAVLAEIERVRPTRVLNAAGVTGRPNVDWCEFNKQTVIRTNVIGCLNLADIC